MKYHSFLTRRILLSRFIPLAAVLAVAFGVFCLIPVLSVMEGFKVEMRERIRGSLSHLVVTSPNYIALHSESEVAAALAETEHVVAAAPYVEFNALYKSGTLYGAEVRGIDVRREVRVGEFQRYVLRDLEVLQMLVDPELRLLPDREPMAVEEIEELFSRERRGRMEARRAAFGDELGRSAEAPAAEGFSGSAPPLPILVGIEALRRGRFRLGDHVQFTSFSPINEVRVRTFMVTGAFQTGVFEQDLSWIFMPIEVAQNYLELFDPESFDMRYSGFAMRLDDYENAAAVQRTIRGNGLAGIPGDALRVLTWEDQRRTLLNAVTIEKRIVSVMMLLVVLFAGVVIFLILTVMGIERTRDLGVLRSLGASSAGVVGLFLRVGMVLCLVGTAIGVTGGYYFTRYINEIHDFITSVTGWRLFPPDVYYLTEIPVAYRWADWAFILVPTIVLGFLASLIPALYAATRDPVRALRHE